MGLLAVYFSLTYNGESGADLMAVAMFPLGLVWLGIAGLYLAAALVIAAASRSAPGRWIGALLDAVPSLLLSTGIVWYGYALSWAGPASLLTAIPIALIWLGASIPGLRLAVRGG